MNLDLFPNYLEKIGTCIKIRGENAFKDKKYDYLIDFKLIDRTLSGVCFSGTIFSYFNI